MLRQLDDETEAGSGSSAQCTMKSGTKITGNYAGVNDSHTETTITACGEGGGVFISGSQNNYTAPTLTMSGGEISENHGCMPLRQGQDTFGGGGVGMRGGSIFNISGGNVTKNHALYRGAGVHNRGTINWSGGSILDNYKPTGCKSSAGGI